MKKIRVLLLDDESVICDLISREIEKRPSLDPQFVLVPSGTGKEAIDILESMDVSPDLLFIDIRLSNGVTGFDVVDRAIQKFDRESMHIVILTGCWEGSVDWDRSMEYLNDGRVDSVLGKWGIGILLSEISSILDSI